MTTCVSDCDSFELPVFHPGYMKYAYQIAQGICKCCGRLLLPDSGPCTGESPYTGEESTPLSPEKEVPAKKRKLDKKKHPLKVIDRIRIRGIIESINKNDSLYIWCFDR